jgi:hypothetical protein
MLTKEQIENIADVRSRGNRYAPPSEVAELKRLALLGLALAEIPADERASLADVHRASDKQLSVLSRSESHRKRRDAHRTLAAILAEVGDG